MSQRTVMQMVHDLKEMQDSTERKLVQAANDLRNAQGTLDQIALAMGFLQPNPPRGDNPLDTPHYTPNKDAANGSGSGPNRVMS
jgi:hypothetical protein